MIGLGCSAPNAAFREVEKCFHDAPSASPALPQLSFVARRCGSKSKTYVAYSLISSLYTRGSVEQFERSHGVPFNTSSEVLTRFREHRRRSF
jgi:hypothetical protein